MPMKGHCGSEIRFPFSFIFCLVLSLLFFYDSAADAAKPAVLIISSNGAIDYNVLKAFYNAGFEIDEANGLSNVTTSRLQKVNVLLINDVPTDAYTQSIFIPAVNDFINKGGGVMLLAATDGIDGGMGADPEFLPLINQSGNSWGVRIRGEYYREGDSSRVGYFPHVGVALDRIDPIPSSPISAGVTHLWLPIGDFKSSSWTNPIYFSDPAWQVVVQAPATAYTQPIPYTIIPPGTIQTPGGITAPPLFGIRQFGNGRIFFGATYPNMTFSQATKFYYNNSATFSDGTYAGSVVLQAGIQGIPSDFGQLLINAMSWLAAPSLNQGVLGGLVTDPNVFIPPGNLPGIVNAVAPELIFPKGLPPVLAAGTQATFYGRDYKGLLGAQTQYSGGSGTVADYAAAARSAGLDFVVFLEDYLQMDPTKLATLEADCQANSSSSLLLVPGYTIDTNTGNHLFVIGTPTTPPIWPIANVLTPDGKKMGIQYGIEGSTDSGYLDWALYGSPAHNIGYYHFSDSATNIKYQDIRLASMGAVRYYEHGQLVEDVTPDYITAAGSFMPPFPTVVDRVTSPAELQQAVTNNNSLIISFATDLTTAFNNALGWHGQAGYQASVSDGPHIEFWPNQLGSFSYGNDPFLPGRNMVTAYMHVTSTVGIHDIEIYNGNKIFRRYLANGATDYQQTLELPRTVQALMPMIVHDVQGHVAVSDPLRYSGASSASVSFCDDYVNDCGYPFRLFRGPGTGTLYNLPPTDAGGTWDGGPHGTADPGGGTFMSLIYFQSNRGLESNYANTPLLSVADPMVIRVQSVLDRLYAPGVGGLAWGEFGPILPTDQLTFVLSHTEWAMSRLASTAQVGLFENKLTFKEPLTATYLQLGQTNSYQVPAHTYFVVRQPDGSWQQTDLTIPINYLSISVPTGTWFGYYNAQSLTNSVLMLNMGEPFEMHFNIGSNYVVPQPWGVVANKTYRPSDSLDYKVFSIADPLTLATPGTARFDTAIRYLGKPERAKMLRGSLNTAAAPIFEVTADSNVAEIQIPRAAESLGFGLPVVVLGLNPHWSIGYFQRAGYNTNYYGNGNGVNLYTELGADEMGRVYASLFPDEADMTDVVIGNPVVCDNASVDIEAMPRTEVNAPTPVWDVAINNPTNAPIVTTCRQTMNPPGLYFPAQTVTLPVGVAITVWDGLRPSTAPPVVFDVSVTSGPANTLQVKWQTDEPSDSQIDWGFSTAYGQTTTLESQPLTVHVQSTLSLVPNATYHLRATSRDVYDNLGASPDLQFQSNGVAGSPSFAAPGSINVRIYPNPWRHDKHSALPITFDQIPAGATVKIFSVSGHVVKTLQVSTPSTTWDLKTDGGDSAASGLYLYSVTDSLGHKAVGKFAVIR